MLRQLLTLCALFACAAVASAGEAGHVVFVAGKADVAKRPAVLDAVVNEGDELSTGADGYIYMKTVDQGFLILRPNSRARVTTYKIDAKHPENTQVQLELLSGVARSSSGLSVKQARQNFRFNTPVAAIGVRGTDFIVHTNDTTSWVSVVSGGVVVSGFAGACGPEGTGPCEGGNSRELFAGRSDLSLQVERGQVVPQLLHITTMSPELNRPARPDEPAGKVVLPTPVQPSAVLAPPAAPGAAAGGSALALNDVSLDAARSTVPKVVPAPPVVVTPPPVVVTPPVEVPPVVVPPVVVPPVVPPVVVLPPDPVVPPIPVPVPDPVVERGPPEIIWGRWQAVAGVAPDPVVAAKLRDGTYNSGVIAGSYVVARVKDTKLVMPNEGTAAFAMTGSEATISKTGGETQFAQVKDAKLTVNFSDRTFATSLVVFNSLGQVNFNANGDVTSDGGLEGAILSANRIRGYLGGAKVDEAVYTFKGTGGLNLTAAGVVTWSR